MTEQTFDAALAQFKASTAKSMKYAKLCADLALDAFAEHGDASKLQQFYDAMPDNFHRKSAFLKWAAAHSPLKREKGVMMKDKSPNATPFQVEKAKALPFWEYAPDKELAFFGDEDVVKALENAIKRFENEERYRAKDENATLKLNTARAMLASLKRNGSNIEAVAA